MVVHVAVSTVHPFILLLVDVFDSGQDPLDILLGIFLRHLSRLTDGTRIVV